MLDDDSELSVDVELLETLLVLDELSLLSVLVLDDESELSDDVDELLRVDCELSVLVELLDSVLLETDDVLDELRLLSVLVLDDESVLVDETVTEVLLLLDDSVLVDETVTELLDDDSSSASNETLRTQPAMTCPPIT